MEPLTFNVVFAGDSNVGKSALLHRFVYVSTHCVCALLHITRCVLQGEFNAHLATTVGLDFATIHLTTDNGYKVKVVHSSHMHTHVGWL